MTLTWPGNKILCCVSSTHLRIIVHSPQKLYKKMPLGTYVDIYNKQSLFLLILLCTCHLEILRLFKNISFAFDNICHMERAYFYLTRLRSVKISNMVFQTSFRQILQSFRRSKTCLSSYRRCYVMFRNQQQDFEILS